MGEPATRDVGGGCGGLAGGVGCAADGGGLFHHLHDGHGCDPVLADEQLDGFDARADGDSGDTGGVLVRTCAGSQVGMGVVGGILLCAGVLGGAQPQALGAGADSGGHQRGRDFLPEPGQKRGAGQAAILRAGGNAGSGSGSVVCTLRFVHRPDQLHHPRIHFHPFHHHRRRNGKPVGQPRSGGVHDPRAGGVTLCRYAERRGGQCEANALRCCADSGDMAPADEGAAGGCG